MSSDQKLESVVCAGCTCLCDDLNVSICDGQIVESPTCQRFREWFERLQVSPRCEIDGHAAEFAAALARAAALLADSRFPLICGMDRLSTQSQMLAFRIARKLKASIDTTLGADDGRAGVLAMQRLGKITASLGEVSSRSDVIVFMNCDPAESHPRFIERFCKSAKSIVVVADQANATSRIADRFFPISRELLGEFLTKTRLGLAGQSVLTGSEEVFLNVIAAAKYGAVVFGALDSDPEFNENTDNLFRLIEELNRRTRFVSIRLRSDANALSAENVLAWSTGYPFAVSPKGGGFEYNRLEYSSERIIERGECDVALICSGDSSPLSDPARNSLARIPQIVITDRPDYRNRRVGVTFHVQFDEGDWCRMDDISLPVVNFMRARRDEIRTANDVLAAIGDRLEFMG